MLLLIDAIAALLPYAEYEAAQTIMSISQTPGRNTELFRDYGPYKEKVKELKRAQVEAELQLLLVANIHTEPGSPRPR